MREPMDAISDRRTREVVVMSSSQVGKTELLLNAAGFFIEQDPSPILAIQPTLEMAIDVAAEIKIERPRAEVTAFVTDPANDQTWLKAFTSVEALTDPPTARWARG